jgi:hypothetical protein
MKRLILTLALWLICSTTGAQALWQYGDNHPHRDGIRPPARQPDRHRHHGHFNPLPHMPSYYYNPYLIRPYYPHYQPGFHFYYYRPYGFYFRF